METSTMDLKERWAELKENSPKMRIRNAAEELGVSEVELLATKVGNGVIRLKSDFKAILMKIESLGKVMALTRNNDVVHERKGVYLNGSFESPHVGLFVGADIDLRIFIACWTSAYAVSEESRGKMRHSIQFFANDGEAIHKIYLTDDSNEEAYHTLVKEFTDENQEERQAVTASRPKPPTKADKDVELEKFREDWRNLQDTHDFFMMLRKYGLDRTQALRLAPEGNFAVKVDNNAARDMITKAADNQTPIMVFVGNKGMIQIHTGEVKKLLDHNEWFNVMDPDFNLHLKEPSIVESWVVRKPSVDGMVTALECYDKEGTQIIQLFGKRKPGIPELEAWRDIVADVESKLKLN